MQRLSAQRRVSVRGDRRCWRAVWRLGVMLKGRPSIEMGVEGEEVPHV